MEQGRLSGLLGGLFVVTVFMAYGSAAQAQEYYIDPVQTSVIFAVKNFDIGFTYGRFNKVEGEMAIDKTIPKDSKLSLIHI